jgi:hypothetical protein
MKPKNKQMKKLLFIAILTIFAFSLVAQITLEPSKGDRFSYYLNGDVWESSIALKSEFALKVYASEVVGKHVWILNFSLKEKEFIELMEFVDSLDKINVENKTHWSENGSDVWFLSSFSIYGHDYYTVPANEVSPPDLDYLMKKIKSHFKNRK